jgi:hypothetical protein
MQHQIRTAIQHKFGRWLVLAIGTVWEVFAISHNLSYIRSVLGSAPIRHAAGYTVSPLFTMFLGAVWLFLSSNARTPPDVARPRLSEKHTPVVTDVGECRIEIVHEVRHVATRTTKIRMRTTR